MEGLTTLSILVTITFSSCNVTSGHKRVVLPLWFCSEVCADEKEQKPKMKPGDVSPSRGWSQYSSYSPNVIKYYSMYTPYFDAFPFDVATFDQQLWWPITVQRFAIILIFWLHFWDFLFLFLICPFSKLLSAGNGSVFQGNCLLLKIYEKSPKCFCKVQPVSLRQNILALSDALP